MIAYLLASYFIMFFWIFYDLVFGNPSIKDAFKAWVLSPIVMPFVLYSRFIKW